MTKAGIGEQTIILAIQRGAVKFDTSPQALVALKSAGVSDQVLNAMLTSANTKIQTTIEAKNPTPVSIYISGPDESNAYHAATTQSDPKSKAAALEQFIAQYPQTVAKNAVLDLLIDIYQQLQDPDKAQSAASRLLQFDPNSLKATFISVFITKTRCAKSVDSTGGSKDPQSCNDSAELARRGMQLQKPGNVSADNWTKQTNASYPLFHSAIALDDSVVKKDYRAAEEEYTAELKLYSDDQIKTVGLQDSLLLAQAYSQPGSTQDLVKAVWFYARVWDFAPVNYKGQIEPKLEYYYKAYHGGLDGLDDVKARAASTTFPSDNMNTQPAQQTTQNLSHGLTLRVLQEQSVPYTEESGGGISTSCSIVGSATTSVYATSTGNSTVGNATTNSNQHMSCNSYDTSMRWPHVLNVMFAQGSDGISYIIACDRAWRWSKCSPLRAGEVFSAQFTGKGIEVQALNAKGKEENPTYRVLQSRSAQ